MLTLLLFAVAPPSPPPDWPSHPVNEWVRVSPRPGFSAPGFLYEGSGGYDPFTRRWLHHAGHDGIPQGFHTFTLDLDTGRWRQVLPPTSPPGACCVDGGNAFDAGNRLFLRFPGGTLGHGYQYSRGVRLKESAVWAFDPARETWTNMRPPPYALEKDARLTIGGLNSAAAYDPNHEVVFNFGGQGSSGGKSTLFVYDAYANALKRLDPPGGPSPRDGMGLAYDAKHDRLVMFGSQYTTDGRTWLYDLRSNRWEGVATKAHPPGGKVTKEYHCIPRLAYDPLNGVVLCVAWLGEKRHETWALDVGKREWTKRDPVAEPTGSKSRSRNLDFDAARNVFVLETSGAKSNRPEVWTYRHAKATPAAPPFGLSLVTEAGKARLTWDAVPGPYEVQRAEAAMAWETRFTRLAGTEKPGFVDEGLKTGKVYYYRVKAGGAMSRQARTQPRVMGPPVVSVLAKDKVEVAWAAHPAADVVGYNLYRGAAGVRTVRKGKPAAWSDNDPEYDGPRVVQVRDITALKKLNAEPLKGTSFADAPDLTAKGDGDYPFGVYAYVVRAVNRLGVESGPSPYALTLPSEPLDVLCREKGDVAELRWRPAAEKAVAGYHVYRLRGTWVIERATEMPVKEPRLALKVGKGVTRLWVTAVDALGQEGQPSSPAWFGRDYRGFHEGEWHP